MRIAIFGLGSRGDVQPYAALAKGLKEAGHSVTLVTNENYQAIAAANGLECYSFSGNVQDVVESPERRSLLEKGNFLAINAYTSKLIQRVAID